MVIDGGYYISERTSNEKPYAHIDFGTLYLPFDVGENEAEEGGYAFSEYRITVPITDDIPADVLKQVIAQVPDVTDAINDTLISVFGDSASIKKTNDYKTAIEATKEKISDDDDKTFGIACKGIFPTWVRGNYIVGDVTTDPDTGYPYECITPHDSIINTGEDYTIKNRTLWKPWHSRKKEYALPWEQPTGAHDMYKAGEYMIWTDGSVKKCVQDTNFSPTEYAQAWEDA